MSDLLVSSLASLAVIIGAYNWVCVREDIDTRAVYCLPHLAA